MKKMDKKTIFYTATKVGKNRNLELFSKQVVDLLMPGVESISFHTTEAVFDFIDKNIGDKKLVCACYRRAAILGGVVALSDIDKRAVIGEVLLLLTLDSKILLTVVRLTDILINRREADDN